MQTKLERLLVTMQFRPGPLFFSSPAMSTKFTIPRTLSVESEQAVVFLERISELLKFQRRHFDDAVVTHCIRLIHDYVAENADGTRSELPRDIER